MKVLSLVKWLVAAILMFLAVGLILANYSAGPYLALGAVVAVALSLLVHYLGWKALWVAGGLGLAVLCAGGLFLWSFSHMPSNRLLPINNSWCTTVGEKVTGTQVTLDQVNVVVVDFSRDSFQVSEQLTYDLVERQCVQGEYGSTWQVTNSQQGLQQDLPVRQVRGVEHALLVHEAIIPSLLPEGYCCPELVQVTILKLPYDSFYDAQYSRALEVDEYLGQVRVTWETEYQPEGIHFAYLPFPYNNLRVVVNPLIDLSKSDNWVLTGLGILMTWIFVKVVESLAGDTLKDWLKKIFHRPTTAPSASLPKSG